MTEHVPQRIGDSDRDQAATCLREHLAQGRLSQDEFDDRIGIALAAKTAADLEPLFSDLPDPRPDTLKGVAPMSSPWPSYPAAASTPSAPSLPAQRPQPSTPAVSSNWSNAMMVATAVAWPLWLLASFATGWHFWWLIWIPITISIVAGKFRSDSSGS